MDIVLVCFKCGRHYSEHSEVKQLYGPQGNMILCGSCYDAMVRKQEARRCETEGANDRGFWTEGRIAGLKRLNKLAEEKPPMPLTMMDGLLGTDKAFKTLEQAVSPEARALLEEQLKKFGERLRKKEDSNGTASQGDRREQEGTDQSVP